MLLVKQWALQFAMVSRFSLVYRQAYFIHLHYWISIYLQGPDKGACDSWIHLCIHMHTHTQMWLTNLLLLLNSTTKNLSTSVTADLCLYLCLQTQHNISWPCHHNSDSPLARIGCLGILLLELCYIWNLSPNIFKCLFSLLRIRFSILNFQMH